MLILINILLKDVTSFITIITITTISVILTTITRSMRSIIKYQMYYTIRKERKTKDAINNRMTQ